MSAEAGVVDTDERLEQGPTLVASLWRFRYQLLVAVVLFSVVGYVLSGMQATQYQATALLILRNPGDFASGAFASDPERYVSQQANLVTSPVVLEPAADALDGQTPRSLEDSLEVEYDSQLNEISVNATSGDPQTAAEIANTVAQEYERVFLEQSLGDVERSNEVLSDRVAALRDEVDELSADVRQDPTDTVAAERLRSIQAELLALESQRVEIAADAAAFGSGVRLRETAPVPESPAAPSPVRDAALAGMLALVVGSAIAYWQAGTRRRVETRTDPGSVLNVPMLGEIPRFKQTNTGPGGLLLGGQASEAYEFVLSSIEFSLAELDGSSVLITSAGPGDGKTATALHLAVASAREARRVILVDADVRVHGLTSQLRAEGHPGLIELADGDVELDKAIRRYRLTEATQLAVVPSGQAPDDSTGLLRAPEFKTAIQRVRDHAELVIIDSPPLLAVADATVLATQVDAIVLVVDSETELDQLMKVQERLAFVPTPVIGYVYNRANLDRASRYGYGYGSKNRSDGGGGGGWLGFSSRGPSDDTERRNGQPGTRPTSSRAG